MNGRSRRMGVRQRQSGHEGRNNGFSESLGEGVSVEGPCLHPSTSVLSIWRQRTDELTPESGDFSYMDVSFVAGPYLLCLWCSSKNFPQQLVERQAWVASADKQHGYLCPCWALMYSKSPDLCLSYSCSVNICWMDKRISKTLQEAPVSMARAE